MLLNIVDCSDIIVT